MSYDPNLSKPSDSMRLALGDTSDTSPVIPEATYTALYNLHGYVEGLAQAAQAILDLPDPTKYKAGSTDAEFDFTGWIAQVAKVRDDCRAGIVHAPGGAFRVGVATPIQNSFKPGCGFRPH